MQPSQSPRIRGSTPNIGTKRHIIEKQSYAAVVASKPSQVPEHPWTQVKYKGRKQSTQQSTAVDSEYQRRRILFPREKLGHQMSEIDLISESCLREQQEAGNRGSAIVITIKGEAETKNLCVSGLRFGGVVRMVKRYWKARPSSVCMRCCGIRHERMGSCGD